MVIKRQIKIVRRSDRTSAAQPGERNDAGVAVLPQGNAVVVVNGWIKELRQKKFEERKKLIGSFFSEANLGVP